MIDHSYLNKLTIDNFPRLKTLRSKLFNAKKEVCIERAKNITYYLKELASKKDSMTIKNAKATSYFLSNKKTIFDADNLLAGSTTSKKIGAPVYPEYTGLLIWPELYSISSRKSNPMLLDDYSRDRLNYDIFPYWMDRNIFEVARKKFKNPDQIKLFERLIFFLAGKAGCISHTIPSYKILLEKGIKGIIDEIDIRKQDLLINNSDKKIVDKLEFYDAALITLEGIITYSKKLSKKAFELADIESDFDRKLNLHELGNICSNIPYNPSKTFREAVNAIWIINIAIHSESINMAISPGRLDQVLYDFYKKDLEKGILDINEAIEIIGCLWIKMNDNTNLVPEAAEQLFGGAGPVPAVTIGGIDKDGRDAVNDLTYIILKTSELLQTKDPSLTARYNNRINSKEYLEKISNTILNTKAIPAVYNDVEAINTLVNQGIKLEDANDYAIIGCVEISSAGRSYDASSSILLNLNSVLELAIFDGKHPSIKNEQIGPKTGNASIFKSFDDFLKAFQIQLKWVIKNGVELNEMLGSVHQEILQTPLLSCFFEGPIEKGSDLIFGGATYNSSGATHIGFADVVDSLNAIEKTVFIDKFCSFSQLKDALQNNFKGYEKLQTFLINRAPKYGTNDDIALKNSQSLIKFLYEIYQGHTNYRGGRYRPAYWSMTNHAGYGKISGASASGREANTVFSSGITPSSQLPINLSSSLKSVASLNNKNIPGGYALNLKYSPINEYEDKKRFSETIEAYFLYGGMQVQFNIMTSKMLIDAKNNPDKYTNLLVRVSGYSAFFNDLSQDMKNEIIMRTEYQMGKRKEVFSDINLEL